LIGSKTFTRCKIMSVMERRTDVLQEWKCRFGEELRLDVGRFALGRIHEREDGHVSGIPAVHGLVTNLAPGVTPLLKRQTSRRHLIFSPAIGTFEVHYAPTADDEERPAAG
jgi:hypothetical protein